MDTGRKARQVELSNLNDNLEPQKESTSLISRARTRRILFSPSPMRYAAQLRRDRDGYIAIWARDD